MIFAISVPLWFALAVLGISPPRYKNLDHPLIYYAEALIFAIPPLVAALVLSILRAYRSKSQGSITDQEGARPRRDVIRRPAPPARYFTSFFTSASTSANAMLRLTTLPSLSTRIIVGSVQMPNRLAGRLSSPPDSKISGQGSLFSVK